MDGGLAKIKQGGVGLRTAGCRDRQRPGPRHFPLQHHHQKQQQQRHVQSPASPPLQTQTLWGQGLWTWPCGPQENVNLVCGIIWDLFGRRSCLRQHYASLSSVPLCSRGRAQSRCINTPFYLHLQTPSINTSNWQWYSFKYISTALKSNFNLIFSQ